MVNDSFKNVGEVYNYLLEGGTVEYSPTGLLVQLQHGELFSSMGHFQRKDWKECTQSFGGPQYWYPYVEPQKTLTFEEVMKLPKGSTVRITAPNGTVTCFVPSFSVHEIAVIKVAFDNGWKVE